MEKCSKVYGEMLKGVWRNAQKVYGEMLKGVWRNAQKVYGEMLKGVWKNAQNAYFDVRVVNSDSQKNIPVEKILSKHEQDKKRNYNRRIMNFFCNRW